MDSTSGLTPCVRPGGGIRFFSRHMKALFFILLLAPAAFSQTPAPSAAATVAPAPVATGKGEELTVEQQGNSPADLELTKAIRRALVKNESLSSMAKNVKVIVINGKVTLRGPVHSEQEKTMVGGLAEKAAGKDRVTNLLEVRR
jgi:hyperosmotically inducible periplasmic protein